MTGAIDLSVGPLTGLWRYYVPGLLILTGAGVYSRARRARPLAVSAEPE